MPFRAELLLEFRAAYERMEAARASASAMGGDEAAKVRSHAERNFQACAEALARQVPLMIDPDPIPVPESWRSHMSRSAD